MHILSYISAMSTPLLYVCICTVSAYGVWGCTREPCLAALWGVTDDEKFRYCVTRCATMRCETAHFGLRNGPFRRLKWAVSQAKMGRFANQLFPSGIMTLVG